MPVKIGVVITVVLTVLFNIGCSSEGVFENPDSIRVTTLEAIHGKRGHLVTVDISKDVDGIEKQVVLEIQDPEVTDAVLYVLVKSSNRGIGGMIDLLQEAEEVTIVSDIPEDKKPWTRLVLTLGGKGGSSFEGYLQVTGLTGIEYLSLKGTVTEERVAWFLAEVVKPPKVLDTRPAEVVEIAYYRDPDFTMPLTDEVVAEDSVYSKVVFSKDTPIVFASDGLSQPNITSDILPGFSPNAHPELQSVRFPIEFQYRMQPGNTMLQSGEAQPYQGSNSTFICRYDVKRKDLEGLFRTHANHHAASGAPLRIIFFTYTGQLPANTGETIISWQPTDFVGQVYTVDPEIISEEQNLSRSFIASVAGVTVTIMAGPRTGESTVTDRNGRYRFLNVTEDTLRLRTEREHFEPKEVLVYRNRPRWVCS